MTLSVSNYYYVFLFNYKVCMAYIRNVIKPKPREPFSGAPYTPDTTCVN